MKKILIVTSYLAVAIISGFISVIGYNTALKAKIIEDSEQLEIRRKELQLEYNKRQLELDAQEKVNSLTYRQNLQNLQQREREIELENRKANHKFTQ
jgi:hypothetical protein